jgi:hypothetical protein
MAFRTKKSSVEVKVSHLTGNTQLPARRSVQSRLKIPCDAGDVVCWSRKLAATLLRYVWSGCCRSLAGRVGSW